MRKELIFKLFCYLGVPSLLMTTIVYGDTKGNIAFNNTLNESSVEFDGVSTEKALTHIDIERLATEVRIDTESKFEAILFDYQSQETIGRLYWSNKNADGSIVFEYAGIKDRICLQISDLKEMSLSERYNALLTGLHEAGVAWILQQKKVLSLMIQNSAKQEITRPAASGKHSPFGFFDKIQPTGIRVGFNKKPKNRSRFALGWAFDKDRSAKSIWVHIYGTTSNSPRKQIYVGAVYANRKRPDLNRQGIPGNHGWRFKLPETWDADEIRDRKAVCQTIVWDDRIAGVYCNASFRAYGIDLTGNANRMLKTPLNTQGIVGIGYARTYKP
jgi:hypothetical protein